MANMEKSYEYRIHDSIGIRLTGLSENVESWLKRFQAPLNSPADLEVRVSETMPDDPLRYIELHRYGYSQSGFVMLTRGAKPKKVLIPLENLGNNCLITCEKGANSVPMLQEIIHLSAIQKGFLPLHASAFNHEGQTILASAWPQGGKTSLLFAFSQHGADYISDDWTYLDAEHQAYGIPLPVTVRSWQLEQLPDL